MNKFEKHKIYKRNTYQIKDQLLDGFKQYDFKKYEKLTGKDISRLEKLLKETEDPKINKEIKKIIKFE